jgi:uncharacterized protein YerC
VTETWKPVPGYPKYQVSDLGRIQNLESGRFLNPAPTALGYVMVDLGNHEGRKRLSLHRIVADVFCPGRTAAKHIVHHIDNDGTNNAATNLEWVTQRHNLLESVKLDGPFSQRESPTISFDLTDEKWVHVSCLPGLERVSGYLISSSGRVRGADRYLKPGVQRDGYLKYVFYVKGWQKKVAAHRLVAMAFVPGRTDTRTYVNHLDRNRQNNHFTNLAWCTSSENRQHASPIVEADVVSDIASGKAYTEIAVQHGINRASVARIARKHGYHKGKGHRRLPKSHRDAIIADLKEGRLCQTDIAKKHRVGTTTVRLLSRGLGISRSGTLPEVTRENISAAISRGDETYSRIAERFGVSRCTVTRIAKSIGEVRRPGPLNIQKR